MPKSDDADGTLREPKQGGLPRRGWGTFEVNGVHIGVVNGKRIQGRVFMRESPSTPPFEAHRRSGDRSGSSGVDIVLVDIAHRGYKNKLTTEYADLEGLIGWIKDSKFDALRW